MGQLCRTLNSYSKDFLLNDSALKILFSRFYSVSSEPENSYLSGVERQRAENAWHTAAPPFG